MFTKSVTGRNVIARELKESSDEMSAHDDRHTHVVCPIALHDVQRDSGLLLYDDGAMYQLWSE